MVRNIVKEWEIDRSEIDFRSPLVESEAKARGMKPNDEGKYVIGKGGFGVIYLVECHSTLATMKYLNAPGEYEHNIS